MDRLRQDVSYLHVVVDLELLCDDVRSVKFLVDHAAADRVTVKTYEHVKERGAVEHDEFLVAVDGA